MLPEVIVMAGRIIGVKLNTVEAVQLLPSEATTVYDDCVRPVNMPVLFITFPGFRVYVTGPRLFCTVILVICEGVIQSPDCEVAALMLIGGSHVPGMVTAVRDIQVVIPPAQHEAYMVVPAGQALPAGS